MVMRLPGSGTLLESLLNGLGQPAVPTDSGTSVDAVSEAQLKEALNSLAHGEIEFVILEDGPAFLQAAGEGDGPYAVEHCENEGAPLTGIDGGVDRATAERVMLAFRRGDAAWRLSHSWTAV